MAMIDIVGLIWRFIIVLYANVYFYWQVSLSKLDMYVNYLWL